jgi:hypothetical protein
LQWSSLNITKAIEQLTKLTIIQLEKLLLEAEWIEFDSELRREKYKDLYYNIINLFITNIKEKFNTDYNFPIIAISEVLTKRNHIINIEKDLSLYDACGMNT